ncbi:hypothetical protein [Epibacterium sp. Ofav1-8]|uniref:hypothetical protein n=1 Tax=Epibacterium sp. Ofav1-8 TaxID=2917735 RepID=UPI001EF3F8F6|nr:hypothetical protein [Epibacterium sp. Ofav1-8]MCG7625642.1 hypothetical protein [Epibacterium sp. Ofav1-8]
MKQLKNFLVLEDGAVTVDWVVLVALVVGFVIVTFTNIMDASEIFAGHIATYLTNWTF